MYQPLHCTQSKLAYSIIIFDKTQTADPVVLESSESIVKNKSAIAFDTTASRVSWLIV